MKPEEWKQYFSGMVARGNMRPEKNRELVVNCGGQKQKLVANPSNPLLIDKVLEPFEEAAERIRGEILEMASRGSLERKADQILAELRRR